MNKLTLFITVAAAVLATGCKKENTKTDYSTSERYNKDVVINLLTPTLAQQVYNATQAERNQFADTMEMYYPGMLTNMNIDASEIIAEPDSATQLTMLDSYNNYYHTIVADVWSRMSYDTASLRSKYELLLGHNSFNIGEFGQLILGVSTPLDGPGPDFPDNYSFAGCDHNYQDESSSCGAIALGNIYRTCSSVWGQYRAAIAGGCAVSSTLGDSITIPDNFKTYVNMKANVRGIRVYALAFALGGAYAESSLSMEITRDNVPLRTRELHKVMAIAPIIWYAEQEYTYFGPADNFQYLSYGNADGSKLVTGVYGFNLFSRMNHTSAGIAGTETRFSYALVKNQISLLD